MGKSLNPYPPLTSKLTTRYPLLNLNTKIKKQSPSRELLINLPQSMFTRAIIWPPHVLIILVYYGWGIKDFLKDGILSGDILQFFLRVVRPSLFCISERGLAAIDSCLAITHRQATGTKLDEHCLPRAIRKRRGSDRTRKIIMQDPKILDKKARSNDRYYALNLTRHWSTLPASCPASTINAGGLNYRIRNGNGCDPSALSTGNIAATS